LADFLGFLTLDDPEIGPYILIIGRGQYGPATAEAKEPRKMNTMTNREAARIAKKMLGHFNEPKATRDIKGDRKAMTFVKLPNGETVKLFGFAHERQTAQVVRKHMRDVMPVEVSHVIVKFDDYDQVLEVRARFVDRGISRQVAGE
jgi:hypothetical protein